MSKKKRKKQQIHKKTGKISVSHNILRPFVITFGVVLAAGLCLMAAYAWIIAPTRVEDHSHFQLTKEAIAMEDVEAQVSEIMDANDKYLDILNDPEYMAENNIYAKDAKNPDQITIAFAGDILFDAQYAVMSAMLQNGGDISTAIAPELIEEMQNADIMMLNNEFPYSDRGTPTEGKQFTFRAKPSYVSYLDDLGVDLVSLANNHAYDYGEAAFLDTLTTLEEAGITYVGAGRNLEEARRPVYYIIDNMKIAFVSATQIERLDNPDTKGATDSSAGVFRCWNGDNLIETVKEAKENSDFVIVYLHWGTENEVNIDWAQEKQAPEVASAGADLIIGDHPHCLQQISVVQGVPVIYSLGNFWFNSKTVDTGMVKVTLSRDGLQEFQFIPCLQSGSRTTLLQGEEKTRVLDYMRSISGGVLIDDDGYVTW
ncbi:MAG: CapA family protein [Lachnospiraceae bacterium]|nr:CapA family protein [Lachnospiraceae bacterium]